MADRSSHSVPVLVIGLGRFGTATALQLARQGREVLGVERDAQLVQKLSGQLTHVVEAEATDIDALRQLGDERSANDGPFLGVPVEAPA